MQIDFHYYATYCAAFLAGYAHEECMTICYSAQFVDLCSRTLLSLIKGPQAAVTTQLQLELADARTDLVGLHDITRIWASFHFLPADLYAPVKKGSKMYKNKYRLICGPNGDLVTDTVELAKGKSLQAVGVAMHVLADTWAHRYFAGTPSMVINNTDHYFYELLPEKEGEEHERKVTFKHSSSFVDDLDNSIYANSLRRTRENSIMNLGHGRAGHLPDYSFARYKYLSAWGGYRETVKDNPSDYYHAFTQMVYALKYLHGTGTGFEKEKYDTESVAPWQERIMAIITKRQLDSSEDWKALGEELSGKTIEPFDMEKYQEEYKEAPEEQKDDTFLGKFFLASMAQKSMVTNKIYKSGNRLAGESVDYSKKGFRGIRDFQKLVREQKRGEDQ